MNVARKLGLLATAIIITPALHTSAGVIAYEGFDYATTDAVNGANGGTGWGGGWVATNATYSFEAQDIAAPTSDVAVGSQLSIVPGGSNPAISRNLSAGIDTDVAQTFYVSALYRREDASNTGGEASTPIRFNTSSGGRLISVGHNSLEDLNIQFPGSSSASATVDFEIGTNYLLLVKIELNNAGTDDVVSVSLLETGEALAEPATWDHSFGFDGSGVIGQFQIGNDRDAGTALIDEIAIGDTFADVVPEPGSLSLVCVGLGCLLLRRRDA